jgi:hypothetical protein
MSFNTLVSATIEQEQECTNRALLAEEEKKRVLSGPSEDSTGSAPLKYHLVYNPLAGKS